MRGAGASSDSRTHSQLERRCQRTSGFSTIALLLGEWENQDLKLFIVDPVPVSVTDMRREEDR
jgi:hypothetical protein